MLFVSRSDAIGVSQRTKKNLEYVKAAFEEGEDVHVVTQLVISLLGMVVLPWEQYFLELSDEVTLDDLHEQGWPTWNVTLGSCDTLGCLIHRVRNATAHGRLHFSSDSRILSEVMVTVEDAWPNSGEVHWRAEVRADHLYDFCIRLADRVEDMIG